MNNKLNIAYISYEYPTKTGGGGIGTYVFQISEALAGLGHHIEVFCGSDATYIETTSGGVIINYIDSVAGNFRTNVLKTFLKKHQVIKFDLIESAEYGADALEIKKQMPNLPLVVKLHAPGFIFETFSDFFLQYQIKKNVLFNIKFQLSKYLRKPILSIQEQDEKSITQIADVVYAPSKALAKKVKYRWQIKKNIQIIPNLYLPLIINVQRLENSNYFTVLFIGKLSVLKGAIELVKIFENLEIEIPNLKLTIIGKDLSINQEYQSAKAFLIEKLSKKIIVEFMGMVPLNEMPQYYIHSDIYICPSLFENFPTTILEAMNFRCPIIAYKSGGIPEMIIPNKTGILVPIKKHKKFRAEIIKLYKNKQKREYLATNAHKYVNHNYGIRAILKNLVELYKSAIVEIK